MMKKIFFILGCVLTTQFALQAYGNTSTAAASPSASTTTPKAEVATTSITPTGTTDTTTAEPEGTAGTPLSPKATTIKAKEIAVDDEAFKEVLTTAYTNSPALGAAEYQTKAAYEDVSAAKAGWGPTLDVGADYNFEFDHDVYGQGVAPGRGDRLPNGYRQYTRQGNAALKTTLRQNIYAGGYTSAKIEDSKQQALMSEASYARGQQNSLLKAAKALLDVVKTKAIQELHAGNVEVLKKRLDVAKARFEFGDLTIADVASTEAKLDKARSELTAAKAEWENAKAVYRKDIGKDPIDTLSIPSVPKFLPASREEAVQLTLQKNPILRQMDAKINSSKAKLDASYAGLKPEVNLTASAKRNLNYAWNENSSRNFGKDRRNQFMAGAEFKLPLDVMGANQSRIRKAKYESALERISSIYQRQDIVASTVKAWETYKALESRITELQSQVKAAKVALDTYTEGYLVGNNTTLEVLTAEQEYFSAQVELTRVRLDFLSNAFALAEAAGVLTPENLGIKVRTFDGTAHYENISRWGLGVKHDQTEYGGETLEDLA